jgi:hypothetical protein
MSIPTDRTPAYVYIVSQSFTGDDEGPIDSIWASEAEANARAEELEDETDDHWPPTSVDKRTLMGAPPTSERGGRMEALLKEAIASQEGPSRTWFNWPHWSQRVEALIAEIDKTKEAT